MQGQPGLVRSLLRIATSDPPHMPENLAVWALRVLGPKVPGDLAGLRNKQPDADARQLSAAVVRSGVRETSAEGAFVGGPLLVFVPFAFAAALLAQLKMVLRMAGVAGRDPVDSARAGELLVVLGVYPTVERAAAAIADSGAAGVHSGASNVADPADTTKPPGKWRIWWNVSWRLARLLGVTAPASAARVSLLIRIGRLVLVTVVCVVGFIAPLVWLPYLAYTYRRATNTLAERSAAFYFGTPDAADAQVSRTAPGMVVALLRAAISVLLAVGAVVLLLVVDVRIAGQSWLAMVLVLFGLSTLTAAVWWWRRRRQREQS